LIKAKVAFLEGRLFSSQSELFENFSDCSNWLDKSQPSKKATFFCSCKQANSQPNKTLCYTHGIRVSGPSYFHEINQLRLQGELFL